MEQISKTSVASLANGRTETEIIHGLIAQYLAHDGYVDTARAFAQEVRAEQQALSNGKMDPAADREPEEDVNAINRQRMSCSNLILWSFAKKILFCFRHKICNSRR
jgi:Ran-binding protein 9/10